MRPTAHCLFHNFSNNKFFIQKSVMNSQQHHHQSLEVSVANVVSAALAADFYNSGPYNVGPVTIQGAIDPSIGGVDHSNTNSNSTELNIQNLNEHDANGPNQGISHDGNNHLHDNDGSGMNQQHDSGHDQIMAEIPVLPPGCDPKKVCPFCGKTFSHPGSLGRHLDLKKGTRLHPVDAVDQIRGNVKRRGDIFEIRARRARRSKEYNARDDVKERNRARRRLKDRRNKAREASKTKFLERLGTPQLPPHPSFAYLVLYYLTPQQWPHDPPTLQTYTQLESLLDASRHQDPSFHDDYMSKLNVAYDNWSRLSQSKKVDVWAREQRRAAEEALGQMSLFDLGQRNTWLAEEEKRITALIISEGNEDSFSNYGHDGDDVNMSESSADKSHKYDQHDVEDSASAALAAVVAAVGQTNGMGVEDGNMKYE